jgi:hypothetical protein
VASLLPGGACAPHLHLFTGVYRVLPVKYVIYPVNKVEIDYHNLQSTHHYKLPVVLLPLLVSSLANRFGCLPREASTREQLTSLILAVKLIQMKYFLRPYCDYYMAKEWFCWG